MRCFGVVFLVVLGLLLASTAGAQTTADLEAQIKKMQEQIDKQQAELKALQEAIKAESTERKTEIAKKADVSSLESLKLKTDNVKIGGDIRLRAENYDNVFDLGNPRPGVPNGDSNDSVDSFSLRTRLSFDVNIAEDLRAYIRLLSNYTWGDSPDSTFAAVNGDQSMSKDISIDNAFIEWKNVMESNVTMKFGRQDLQYGEGFVLYDGTHWDRSRSVAFDALKASINLDDTVVDLFLAKVFENQNGLYDDETLYGIYAVNKSLENHTLEAYALYKDANAAYWTGKSDTPACGKVIPPSSVVTVGARASGKVTDALTYAGEIAGQRSDVQAASVFDNTKTPPVLLGTAASEHNDGAISGYLHGTYAFKELSLKPELTAGFTYLDADWDGMYSTWTKYSETLLYMFYDGYDFNRPVNMDPTRSAWSNMYFPSFDITLKPTEKLSATLACKLLTAVEGRTAAQLVPGTTGGTGSDMGDLYQALLKYQFSKNLSGHLLLEYFEPGGYFPDDSDAAYFSRWELMLTF